MKAHLTIRDTRLLAAWLLFAYSLLPPVIAETNFRAEGVTAVPPPTGPHRVGTLLMRLVDPTRVDPFRRDGTKRELLLRFWYPAAAGQVCRVAEYTSPKVWAYVSRISGIALPSVRTNSCLGARVEEGAHPVILFSHGYTGALTDATFIFEELASRGYVVAAIGHTYESTAVEFPDGRVVTSIFGSYLGGDPPRMDYQSLQSARSARLADLRFVTDELSRLDAAKDGPFASRLDLARVAVMGHSLGGEVALASVERETRLRAAILLDAVISQEVVRGTAKPVLLIAGGRSRWSHEECQLWTGLSGTRLAVNLKHADHFTPTDAIWLLQGVPGMDSPNRGMGWEKTVAALRSYIVTFLDRNLLGKSPDPPLDGTRSNYSDAVVTNQPQSLCYRVTNGGLP